MPTSAGMPGTTSKRMPCSCRNSASLPPLSNTNGSPHFSRTTYLPSRAFSATSRQIASCAASAGRGVADVDALGIGRAIRSSRGSISVSWTTTSARSGSAARAPRSGRIPGPAPTMDTGVMGGILPARQEAGDQEQDRYITWCHSSLSLNRARQGTVVLADGVEDGASAIGQQRARPPARPAPPDPRRRRSRSHGPRGRSRSR